jgi:GNAT superfamily N-acetyltransferase
MHRHDEGFELDADLSRLDLDLVERWLAVESYWAYGRPREQIERSLANSTVYGLYNDLGFQVGLFRVVTDRATFAWLCDVYISPTARGRGVGTWLVEVVRQHLIDDGVPRIILATADAHGVYERVGFTPLAHPHRWMEIDLRPVIPSRPPRERPGSRGRAGP